MPFSLRRAVRENVINPVKVKFKRKKHKKIEFDINLTEHCNLNCKSCGHFSCLAEEEFISIEEFKRDMTRMGELFDHECDNVRLIGGEPLLHPDVIELTKIARQNFTKGEIYIITNGILLTRMSDDFWRMCHDYKISIRISHYPIEIHIDKIKELAEKFDVKCFWQTENFAEFYITSIDLDGKQDIDRNFKLCGIAISCAMLNHGRLYPCTFAAQVRHFNKKFNKNVVITENDSIDIYSNITKDEILTKLAKPIQACRFCKLDNRKTTKWDVSKGDINEWL